MDRIDCIVIGAGVVGLAVARALALAGREVVVVEANPAIGMETSSRNSEVIHAGIYYPSGSLKARLCLAGRDALAAYCAERGIGHRLCGKLIVAAREAETPKLRAILDQAQANGCREVHAIAPAEASRLEPALSCVAALLSPQTGIVDSHGLMLALQGDAENAGALCAFDSRVVGGAVHEDGIALRIESAGDATEVLAATVVNCAGLESSRIARRIEGLDPASIPVTRYAKGNYYSLSGRAPFSRLIYPVPQPGGLGVHLTLDLAGQARFGPDVEWLDQTDAATDAFDYRVDPRRADAFYREIRAYWPDLPDASLQPAYSGIRPKLVGPGEPAADFLFTSHGNPRYLGLYGMESPGLTASLAIGDHVLGLLAAAQ